MTKTAFVPWSQIIVLPPVQMCLVDEAESKMPKVKPSKAFSFLNSLQYQFEALSFNDTVSTSKPPCSDHDHEMLKPILTSTWMPNAVGAMPGKSLIFAENQVTFNFVI